MVDIDKGTVAGTIMNTPGVHGVALAPALNRGFVSDGRSDTVTVFDMKTLATVAEWKTTGANPDAILYEPGTKRLFTFNGRGKNATVFDATNGTVVATIDLAGKPEFAQTDGTRVFVNIEDTSEIAIIDPKKAVVEKRAPLAPCQSPSGLALDRKHHRLFSVCENEKMVVTDAESRPRRRSAKASTASHSTTTAPSAPTAPTERSPSCARCRRTSSRSRRPCPPPAAREPSPPIRSRIISFCRPRSSGRRWKGSGGRPSWRGHSSC